MAGHRNNRNNLVLLSALSLLVLTVVVTQVSSSPFYLGTAFAAPPPPDIGSPPACPSLAGRLASNLVSVSTSTSGNTITYKFSSADESSSNGVPGLVAYCVYTGGTNPTATLASALGADGSLFDTGISAKNNFFGYGRSDGAKSNLPLDGTQNLAIGTATFSALPTVGQTILLHIDDRAECERLYPGTTSDTATTCFVLPGTISQHLIVHKVTAPSSDTSTPFTITASGTGTVTNPGPLTITGGSSHDYSVTSGTYSVSETNLPSGWTKTGDTCQGVVVPVGQTKECTITNTFTAPPPPQTAHLTINKDSGAFAGTFSWTVTGPSTPTEQITTTDNNGVFTGSNGPTTIDAGSYSITEGSTANFIPTGASCTITHADQTTTTVSDPTQSFTVAPGDNVVCDYKNQAIGTIIINKIAKNGDGQFGFTVTGPSSSSTPITTSGGTGTTGPVTVYTGTYTISESSIPLNWGFVSVICTDGTTTFSPTGFAITPGKTVTCTFTNIKATKTQGFWANHVAAAGTVLGATSTTLTGDNSITKVITMGGSSSGKKIDDLPSYFGAFLSGISKNSDGTARTALNQAKMQLTQQAVAAIMNCNAFGSIPAATYEGLPLIDSTCNAPSGTTAVGKYLNTVSSSDASKVIAVATLLDTFNNSGDPVATTLGSTSADANLAKNLANKIFADTGLSGTETGAPTAPNGLSGIVSFNDKYWSDFNGGTVGYEQPFDP